MKNTTINIPKSVRELLKGCRKYKRESYAEVLVRLVRKEKQKGETQIKREV